MINDSPEKNADTTGAGRADRAGHGVRPVPGDRAPNVVLTIADGTPTGAVKPLTAWQGAPLILYFYPRDATPGCTTEANDFSQAKAAFDGYGANILGVSRDDLASHAKFIARQRLTFALAADEDGSVCEAFGVWVEKSLYGRKFMGVERATFLIDPKGLVVRVWSRVKVRGHADEVLLALGQWTQGDGAGRSGQAD